MNRKVQDAASTSDVVWAAATKIGKASSSNEQEVNRICEYLVHKHWFQTAGDLRVARENAQEWHALEVPGRLKIAIQEVLDAPADSVSASLSPLADGSVSSCVDNSSTAEPVAFRCEVPYSATATGESDEYCHYPTTTDTDSYTYESGTDATNEYAAGAMTEEEAAAHAAAWEAYYAANGYYSPTTTTDTSGTDSGTVYEEESAVGSATDVVEAHEVVVHDADEVDTPRHTEEEAITQTMASWTPLHARAEHTVPVAPASPTPTTPAAWSCGQCTYANPISVSFCEICCGHISLSPDFTAVPTQSVAHSEEVVVPPPPPASSTVSSARSALDLALDLALPASTSPRPVPAPVEAPLYVSIPCPSPPVSPLYSPSAPDFEGDDVCGMEVPVDQQRTATKSTTTSAFLDAHGGLRDGGGKQSDLSLPVPTAMASTSGTTTTGSSPPKIDYRALAFKRTTSMPSQGGGSPQKKNGQVTEFSF